MTAEIVRTAGSDLTGRPPDHALEILQSRLAQAQLLVRGGKASRFRNDHERAQLSKVHFNASSA